MKQLLILRHAKSSWQDSNLDDHDRPLNRRGQRDAPRMGRLLSDEGMVPDRIVSSTALRARTTAEEVAAAGGYRGAVTLSRELYLASPREFLRLLREVDDACTSVLVVGHNPGMEELVLALTGEDETMPTAALARVDLPIDSWNGLRSGVRGRLVGVWRPKMLNG